MAPAPMRRDPPSEAGGRADSTRLIPDRYRKKETVCASLALAQNLSPIPQKPSHPPHADRNKRLQLTHDNIGVPAGAQSEGRRPTAAGK